MSKILHINCACILQIALQVRGMRMFCAPLANLEIIPISDITERLCLMNKEYIGG